MDRTKLLIVGAGISGLAVAARRKNTDYQILEADSEIGGYCKTIKKDGFVWDYSGHFFHFKNPQVEQWLRERISCPVLTVNKRTFIAQKDRWVDFPFQKNIHQLPQDEFIDCLYDLYFASETHPSESNFLEMLYRRFGRGIAEKFLIPYNEKLYATDLASLDVNAMGRFFPHANIREIISNMKLQDNASYNSTFTYPEGGAIEYVNALASEVDPARLHLNEALVGIDLERKIAKTNLREIAFEQLVSSVPFSTLARLCGLAHDPSIFSWNKVLVFNLGFDKKGSRDVHWVYFPNRETVFYRIGYYDNIFGTDRMSLYVEIGFSKDQAPNPVDYLARVLDDLRKEKIIDDHKLVAHHSVVMDPAYVHITQNSIALVDEMNKKLRAQGVYSIGRYGGWTYCSIEDNILEAWALPG